MDVVTHNGIDYTKATVAAKEFGYTTDYIGQLCRAKKVDARLVGRAWYVNIDSLDEHKKGRYKADFLDRVKEQDPLHELWLDEPEQAEKSAPKRQVKVEPVLKNKTVRMTRHFKDGMVTVPVNYDPDEEDLLPTITKADAAAKPVTATERPRPEPVRVKIPKRRQTKPTIMRPEELPEIVLKGRVAVKAVQPQDLTMSDEKLTNAAPAESDAPAKASSKSTETKKDSHSRRRDNVKNKAVLSVASTESNHNVQTVNIHKWSTKETVRQFVPASVQAKDLQKKKTRTQSAVKKSRTQRAKEEKRGGKRYAAGIILALAFFVLFIALSLRVDVTVADDAATNEWRLDFSAFTDF